MISHGTWQKASRWNSRGLVAAAFSLIALLSLPGTVSAQQSQSIAYLQSGPDLNRGVEFLEPNLTPYWLGVYTLGSANIVIWFLDYTVAEADAWERARCSTRLLRSDSDGRYYYFAAERWSVFVAVTSEPGDALAGIQALPVQSDLVCRFVDRFVDRYLYFQRVDGARRPSSVSPPSFPAVLQIQ